MTMPREEPASAEAEYVPGKLSLLEIKTRSLAAAQDTELMTEEMERQAKKDILMLSSNFKSKGLEMDSIKTTQLAKKVLYASNDLGEDQSTQGSGLDLIFRKLDELEKKIHNEQDTDFANEQAGMESCRKALLANNGVITESSDTRANNQLSLRMKQRQFKSSRKWPTTTHLRRSTH